MVNLIQQFFVKWTLNGAQKNIGSKIIKNENHTIE